MKKITKINHKPRFSVNKLGEYLTATATRRKKLIEDQKYPSTFITGTYKIAREAIIKYILKDYDAEILNDAIEKIRKADEIDDTEKANSILALEEVLKHDLPDLSSYKKVRYKPKSGKLRIKELDVSIRPDIILYKGKKVGCIKIHIIKTNRLTKEAGQCVTALLNQYCNSAVIDGDEVVDPKLCISFDCFGYTHEVASKSVTRRMANIEAACEEIVLRWDSV